MARPRRPSPARSPVRSQRKAAAAATPRQGPAPRRGRRLRVQSPSLAAARRGPVPVPAPVPPPATPPLRWPGDAPRGAAAASVRRIAAALWRAHLPPREPGEARRRFEPSPRHPHTPDRCNYYKAVLEGRTGMKPLGSDKIHEVGAYSPSPRIEMEIATKWDSRCLNTLGGTGYNFSDHHTVAANEEISALKEELMQARNRIHELEAESRSAKKKLDHLLRNLAVEKASWRSKEHDKVRSILDAAKGDLNRERKNRQRAEIMSSKLMAELSELKSAAQRYLQDYEKERKARELMEEVCDELAKEIAEDKAEVEALKSESLKMRDEVEEERKMLQMAEVWREERVQMKLVDAKLTLDSKYSQLSELQAYLEAFLNFHRSSSLDKETVRDGEMLMEAINSTKIHDKEFSYKPPPPSEDIFAVFEELRQREDINEKEIGQCNGDTHVGHASKIHTVSPETDILEKPANKYPNRLFAKNEDEDDSGWETVSHVDEQGSSNSPGSEPSVNGFGGGNDASASGTDCEDKCENCRSISDISGVCSTTGDKYHIKGSSFSRLWRSSNGDGRRKTEPQLLKGRLSSGRMYAVPSPDFNNSEVCQISPSVGDWSPDLLNPHLVRAMKGGAERPKDAHKQNLKSKILGVRTNGRMVQLRQALEQKI